MDMSNDTPFNTIANEELSRGDKYYQLFDEHVRSPALIIWSDLRARIGSAILLLFILMGTVGPVVVDEPKPYQAEQLVRPFVDMNVILGTDDLGRSLLGMVVHATPTMMQMILSGAVFATLMATIVGTFSGYKGGLIDMVLTTIADIILTIPGLPLTILLALIFEPDSPILIGLILTVNAWGGLARSIRSEVLGLRQESYVEASEAMGLSTHVILIDEILPNIMPYIFMHFMRMGRRVIFSSVALYFLGVLPFSNLNWGVMLNQAWSSNVIFTPEGIHWLLVPMITIVTLTYGLTLMAQGTDRIFNPKIRARHSKSAAAETGLED